MSKVIVNSTIRRRSTFIILAILISALIQIVTWGIVCLITYGVSLLLANTPFAFEWSWFYATVVWLVFIVLAMLTDVEVKING